MRPNPLAQDATDSDRYIWEVLSQDRYSEADIHRLQALEGRIVLSCQRIWDIVKDVLCDDSPEGLLPQEMEDIIGLGTKDLLSYAFRAIIESGGGGGRGPAAGGGE